MAASYVSDVTSSEEKTRCPSVPRQWTNTDLFLESGRAETPVASKYVFVKLAIQSSHSTGGCPTCAKKRKQRDQTCSGACHISCEFCSCFLYPRRLIVMFVEIATRVTYTYNTTLLVIIKSKQDNSILVRKSLTANSCYRYNYL